MYSLQTPAASRSEKFKVPPLSKFELTKGRYVLLDSDAAENAVSWASMSAPEEWYAQLGLNRPAK